jgi:hypothetical protein
MGSLSGVFSPLNEWYIGNIELKIVSIQNACNGGPIARSAEEFLVIAIGRGHGGCQVKGIPRSVCKDGTVASVGR